MANGAAFCYSSFKFVLLFSRKGMCASTIRSMNETPQSVCRQIPSYSDHFVQSHREKRSVLLNQRCSRLQELGSRRVAMTILCQLVERVQKAAAQADIFLFFKAELRCDSIRRFETNPPDIIGQAIGIFLNYRYGVAAILLINLRGVGSGHIMPLEEENDVFYFLLVGPDTFYLFNPASPYPRNLYQTVWLLLYHIQCFRAKRWPQSASRISGRFP